MKNNITNALLSLLNKGIVRFTYRKVDGSIREAIGSRNLDMLREGVGIAVPTPKTGRSNPTAYFDIEKEDWRSFKAENVLSINDIDIKNIKGVSGGRIVKVSEPAEVEIPINFGGFIGGLPIGGTPKDEPTNFDLGKVGKALGIDLGKAEGKVSKPYFTEKGLVLDAGIKVDDFAKLVAHYVVEEFINRLK
jgi:hypothetical protein